MALGVRAAGRHGAQPTATQATTSGVLAESRVDVEQADLPVTGQPLRGLQSSGVRLAVDEHGVRQERMLKNLAFGG